MTDEDKLIRQFLRESISLPEDNGFSERVMRRLPRRPISMVWTTLGEIAVLVVGSLILLWNVDLTQVFCDLVMQTLQWIAYLRHIDFTFNPLYLAVVLVLLMVWGGNRIKALT